MKMEALLESDLLPRPISFTRKETAMAIIDREPRATTTSWRTPVIAYLAILLVAILIIAGASTIWLTTDDSATNVLASDPQAVTPPAKAPAD